jgi:carboxyl-terminal processing protease
MLRVDVKNQGPGPSGDQTFVAIRNLGGQGIFIKKGRAAIGSLAPGEVKSAALQLEVKQALDGDELPLLVTVVDEKLDEYVSAKVSFVAQGEPPPRAAGKGSVLVEGADVPLRSGASQASAPIALARKGAVLPVLARYGDYYKVEWQKARVGFAPAAEVRPVAKMRRQGAVVEVWQHAAEYRASHDPGRGAPIVDADRWRLEGTASFSPSGTAAAGRLLRDILVFVNERKVLFKFVPETSGAPGVDFAADVPLEIGNNAVTVFARESEELQSRRTLIVYRRSKGETAQDAASQVERSR